ncbi:hypothetical protein CY35_13G091800 [Sphagnum magellanicum]|nr:hypothetical protein CY35_13G091800 [Sphagnum magellanicum]
MHEAGLLQSLSLMLLPILNCLPSPSFFLAAILLRLLAYSVFFSPTLASAAAAVLSILPLLCDLYVSSLKGTEHSGALDLLRLFAYGIWSDYKSNAQLLPALEPQQELKLKQLTVMTLAERYKVLPYDLLMQQLNISNVRELEDLLINDCMYSGIVRGKLDQRRRCFEVHFAAGRDLRPEQLDNMIQTLATWLGNSDSLLLTIQEKIKWADSMSELDRRHKKEVEDKAEEIRKTIKKSLYDTVV